MSKTISSDGRLTGADVLVRNADKLLTTVVDGELIGMSIEQGACYGLNDVATWVCSFAMILGRLEVFTLLVLLTPQFWTE